MTAVLQNAVLQTSFQDSGSNTAANSAYCHELESCLKMSCDASTAYSD